jgi:chemotaxis protein MotA
MTSDFWPEFQLLAKEKSLNSRSSNALINAAQTFWETGISNELFIVMLSQKRRDLENENFDAVHALRNLAKYPPALGMIGTVVGLVGLFSNLGSVNKSGLGPSLALAMTATFFGLILANTLITPLADRLQLHYLWQKRIYGEIYQILLLINRGESLELVEDDHNKSQAA